MLRQCAWCLRLMNSVGERTSLLPVPKNYEATHGICQVCGMLWLEAVSETEGGTIIVLRAEDEQQYIQVQGETHVPSLSPLHENEEKTLSVASSL